MLKDFSKTVENLAILTNLHDQASCDCPDPYLYNSSQFCRDKNFGTSELKNDWEGQCGMISLELLVHQDEADFTGISKPKVTWTLENN